MEVPRQLEATRWVDLDFHVARVSFLDFQLARVTSIWRVAQIHLARVFFRRLYTWVHLQKNTFKKYIFDKYTLEKYTLEIKV